MITVLKGGIRRVFPASLRRRLRRSIGGVWGDLHRTQPISRQFGLDRGQPIDRYYIEKFLGERRSDVCGHVLEIAEDTYTRRFGGQQVTQAHVLHATGGNPAATLVGNLESGEGIPVARFDCVILTQTLPFLFDVQAALQHTANALKPGGVLLATVSGISQISRYDMDRWGDYWRFTSLSLRRLCEGAFPAENVTVQVYGNVLSATAFLYGLAAEEITSSELNVTDPDYEVIICVRAVAGDG